MFNIEERTAQKFHKTAVGLSPFLTSVNIGRDVDLRTPLYGTKSREEIADDAWNVLKLDDLPPLLLEVEKKERTKIGPYSIMLPFEKRKESLKEYFDYEMVFRPNDRAFTDSVLRVSKILSSSRLRPLSLENVYQSSAKSTNWGLPFFTKGSKDGHKYLDLARVGIEQLVKDSDPAVFGWRGQPNGTNEPKQRDVWMFPHAISLHEARFGKPVMQALSSRPEFAWRDINEVRSDVFSRFMNDKSVETVWSFDATGFDKSIQRPLITAAFDLLRGWYQTSYSSDLDLLEEYFSTSGILTPEGLYTGRNGSVPSGSFFTNLIDSLVNLIIQYYISERIGHAVKSLIVQGDDALISYGVPVNEVDLIKYASELGIKVNPTKNVFSRRDDGILNATFLQDLYRAEGPGEPALYGVRSVMRVINGMLSYERFTSGWNKWMDVIRWLSQMGNANLHPRFYELVKWVKQGDKYRLGCGYAKSPKELFALAGGKNSVEETLKIAAFRGPGKELPQDQSPVIQAMDCFNNI